MPPTDDQRWMRRALELASSGLGETWPNPSVGCVLIRDGVVIGEGRTSRGGRPHAETNALQSALGSPDAADAYVTLEPCAHHGETPPCAGALIDAAIKRVIVGATDHDPRVNGNGLARLRDAGIEVVTDICGEAARAILSGFFHKLRTQIPLVISGSPTNRHALERADGVLQTDVTVQDIEGLASHGRLKLRVPVGARGADVLRRLGAHGLTSVYVANDDPLAATLQAEGLINQNL